MVEIANRMPAEDGSATDPTAGVIRLSRSMQDHLVEAVERMVGLNRASHLLSMNARIEAARAGQAGAGFAVVAQELTRLSTEMQGASRQLLADSRRIGDELDAVILTLSSQTVTKRHCDLAFNAMDIIDRNLYERSCDVRWWASESAVGQCLVAPSDERCRYATQRLGEILNSYTVYYDLIIADTRGRIIANGRPSRFSSVGGIVAGAPWFTTAMAAKTADDFGFQSVHESPLVSGNRVLIYSCPVRESQRPDSRVLGILGIVFNWDALGQTVVEHLPLDASERATTRACVVDNDGMLLADTEGKALQQRLDFPERSDLFRTARGSVSTHINQVPVVVAHAASPGFETYRTGWHGLLIRQLES